MCGGAGCGMRRGVYGWLCVCLRGGVTCGDGGVSQYRVFHCVLCGVDRRKMTAPLGIWEWV